MFPCHELSAFQKSLQKQFYYFSLRTCKLSCRYFSGKGRTGDKGPLCVIYLYFSQLKVDPDHQKLLDRIEDLQSEKAAAQSKIRQLQFQMSNDAEEVSKAQEERDELKAEVSKLQLQVEGLKAQVAINDNDYDDDVVDDQMMMMMMIMIMMMLI